MSDVSRRSFLKTASSLPLFFIGESALVSGGGAWPHLRDWNRAEVEKYGEWISNIYKLKREGTWKQKGAKFPHLVFDDEMNLLNNSDFLEEGNPNISKSEASRVNSMVHCGSFPKIMHAYYSYRRGLPEIITKIKSERGGDYRDSYGNHPANFVRSHPFNGGFMSFLAEGMRWSSSGAGFLSGNFRTAPDLEGTDSVPIKIDREFVIPGTVLYNANGHCLVTSDVEKTGEVHFIDSHPDHSITSSQTLATLKDYHLASEYSQDIKKWYDGLRMIRPVRVINGRSEYFPNSELLSLGFSKEQYEEMRQVRKEGEIEVGESRVNNVQEFYQAKLRMGKDNPVDFLESTSEEMANMFRERESFVQEGWKDVLKNGGITFPNDSTSANIYQAEGRWEVWSSPSSDVDRKNKYRYLADRLERMVEGYPDSPSVDYLGYSSREDLIDKILNEKKKIFEREIVSYTTSNKDKIDLTLSEIERRLFDLSFDPNHPPELRWGAPKGSVEREGMKLRSTPLNSGGSLPALKAYELERGLRYFVERQTTPTSLNPANNPSSPPFELLEKKLQRYLK